MAGWQGHRRDTSRQCVYQASRMDWACRLSSTVAGRTYSLRCPAQCRHNRSQPLAVIFQSGKEKTAGADDAENEVCVAGEESHGSGGEEEEQCPDVKLAGQDAGFREEDHAGHETQDGREL